MALQLTSAASFPLTAYSALHHFVDATTFRQGIHHLCQPTCLSTATEYQQLQERVKQLLPLVQEAKSSNWFLTGLCATPSGPTVALPFPTASLLAPGTPTLPTLTAPQPLPSVYLMSPVQPRAPPVARFPTICVTGLHSGCQEAMTAALTLTIGTPVYITSQDIQRAWGIAVVPPSIHASLFSAQDERLLQHPYGLVLTPTCGNETTGEP